MQKIFGQGSGSFILSFKMTSVACAVLAQVWTHYKIWDLNMSTLFSDVCINFSNSQIWKKIMLELNGKPPSVTMSSTDFSNSKTWFFGIYLNFQQQKSLKN
jgi:hypothetical protein